MSKLQFIVWLMLGCAMSMASYGDDADSKTPQASANAAAKTAEGPHFDVWEFRVEGNTVLPRQAVERAVYPYLGGGKNLQDIDQARAALELAYHKAGYATVLVNIPQQKVANGVVRLTVVEGKIDQLQVTGSRFFSLQRIRSRVPALAKGTVPYLPAAQQQLVDLNQVTADRAVTPVLRPGLTPGTVVVELKVQDQLPLHGSLELNDQNSVDTHRLRLSGMLRYDNLWQREHSLSLQYQTSPADTKEVQVLSGTYLARSDTSDNMLALYAVHSDSNTATVGTLAVIGKGDIAGLRYIVPLKNPSLEGFHSLTYGVDYKNFKESVVLEGADSVNTPISYVPFLVQYGGSVRTATSQTQYGVTANFSVRGLGNDQTKFSNKRYKARADYAYLRANVDRTQDVYRGIGLRVKLDGQISDSPLISSEEFSAGGANSVRGYHEAERLGDNGIQGTVELISPSLGRGPAAHLQDLRALLFWDGAALRVLDALPGQDNHFQLSSAGFGFRLQAWRHLTASLDWAQVFFGTGAVHDDSRRIHFDLQYTF